MSTEAERATKRATDAIRDIAAAREVERTARERRDAAIVDMYKAGMKPGQIADETGMSTSNVRVITDRVRWAELHQDR